MREGGKAPLLSFRTRQVIPDGISVFPSAAIDGYSSSLRTWPIDVGQINAPTLEIGCIPIFGMVCC